MTRIFSFLLMLFLLINGLELKPMNVNDEEAITLGSQQGDHECYNKLIGTKGYIQSPYMPMHGTTCVWIIDGTSGFRVELQFVIFRLPVIPERRCDSYIEISYGTQNDSAKHMFCPADKVDRVTTDSQTVLIRYHSGTYNNKTDDRQYGFKINFSAVPVTTVKSSISILTVTIITVAIVFVISLLLLSLPFLCCRRRGAHSSGSIPTERDTAPNAPTLEELERSERQAIMVRQGHNKMNQEMNKLPFEIFQSTSENSFQANLTRWSSVPQFTAPKPEKRHISYATTPRSAFHESNRRWSEICSQRLSHLRTRLVTRFSTSSSQKTCDVSVFYPASSHFSERGSYSQLSTEEDGGMDNLGADVERCEIKTFSFSKPLPSIVVEFVE